jgi:hypothetical protein
VYNVDDWIINELAGETSVFTEKIVLLLLCTPQIPHDLGSNPSRRGPKAMTNRLSYSSAHRKKLDARTGRQEGCVDEEKRKWWWKIKMKFEGKRRRRK